MSDHSTPLGEPLSGSRTAGFPRHKTSLLSNWLSLAAAPTFAAMAILTAAGSSPDMICSSANETWTLGGMAPMYALMSVFHLAPWLKLVSGFGRS